MTKHTTIELTEDQARALQELCANQFGKGNDNVHFYLRIALKIHDKLAKAKTEATS